MKTLLAVAALICCCVGCIDMKEIDFVYFNLGTNEIVVDSIIGLPPWASPGVLVPSHAEDRLSEKSAISYDGPVAVPVTLKIVWHETGMSRQAELKRDELGIPAKINKGKIRFTYLGADKWRVKVFK
jgi:hypothetical protein